MTRWALVGSGSTQGYDWLKHLFTKETKMPDTNYRLTFETALNETTVHVDKFDGQIAEKIHIAIDHLTLVSVFKQIQDIMKNFR